MNAAQQFPSLVIFFDQSGIWFAALEFAGVFAGYFVNGANDKVATATALIGAAISELPGVLLNPFKQSREGAWHVGIFDLGAVIGQQYL